MELKDYLRILRAHWMGVLVLALIGGAAAGVWSLTQPKVYAANASGFVTTGKQTDPTMQNLNDVLAKSRVKSYVALATDRSVAENVIKKLGLDESPEALINNIQVEQPADTVLLSITARASSPEGAQRLADTWVDALGDRVAEVEGTGKNSQGMQIESSAQAALPTKPVSPKTNFNILIGALLGGLLGLAYAVVRANLDKRIRRPEDVEKEFGIPVIGIVPEAKLLQHSRDELTPIAVSEESAAGASPTAEAFRKIRTNLAFMDVDNPPRVIVMTSPQQSDGKSTLAANLAAAIAATGQRITLIDGDLRRPTIANAFGLVEGVGVTDVLVGRLTVAEALQTHGEFPALRVMAAGSRPPNPSELLGSQAMKGLLDELAKDGMVIIDAPPLLPVTDAAVLARAADGAVVTASVGKTDVDELRVALNNVEQAKGKILGILLNRVSKKSTSGYYYSYYDSDTKSGKKSSRSASGSGGARKKETV